MFELTLFACLLIIFASSGTRVVLHVDQ